MPVLSLCAAFCTSFVNVFEGFQFWDTYMDIFGFLKLFSQNLLVKLFSVTQTVIL